MEEKDKKKYPESQRKYNREYQKRMIKMITIMLNRNTDKDIIDYLDGIEKKQIYFKELIRQDIKKHTN